MNGKSEILTERILIIALIIIFTLLLVLSSYNPYQGKGIAGKSNTYPYERPLAPVAAIKKDDPLAPAATVGKDDPSGISGAEANDVLPDAAGALPYPAVKTYSSGHAYGRSLCVNIAVKNKGSDTASNIRLEIPLLAELDSPYQEIAKETFSHEPVEVKRLSNNNRIAVFQLDSLRPGACDTITLEYFLNVYPLNLKQLMANNYHNNLFPQNFLGASEKIESNHPDIIRKAHELTSACDTDLEKARAICSFVITYLKYDINSGSRNSGALIALRSGSGVCEDYASLFAALCRASGIPARVVNGYCDPKGTGDIWNLSPGERFPLQGYRHSWVEFYLHGSGWIPADPTMDIQSGSMKYFGSLPQASHLAQNYEDIPLKVRYKGAQLSVTWEEELVGL